MNTILTSFLGISCLTTSAIAQTTLTGSVHDGAGKPLPFASIALLNSRDSSLVKGTLSQETGFYAFDNVRPGQYRLSASAMGYASVRSEAVVIANTSVKLPDLTLREAAKTLGEVTVAAQKPLFEQQMDRMVINVQSSITNSGGTALDVLERSPGVSVNRQSNSIAMNGKEGVMVMLNGKLTRLPMTAVVQMLSGMNANNIEKIELITTPPASFDAEGNAGLINIVTKKNTNLGTNGSYSLNFGYGKYERTGASININHRSEKLNIYADYSGLMNHFRMTSYNNRTIYLPDVQSESNYVGDRDLRNWSHNGRVGLDYTVSPKTTVSGLLSAFSTKQNQLAYNDTDVSERGVPTTKINVRDQEINEWQNYAGNVNLRHKFSPKQEISADVDYLHYYNNDPHQYVFDYTYLQENRQQQDLFNNSKQTPIRIWVAKTDYTLNTGKNFKLEAGIKGTFSNLNNKVIAERFTDDAWVVDPQYSQNVFMTERITAAYVNMNKPLTAKTKLQAGLRYEHTITDLNTADHQNLLYRNYGNWFPSVALSHDLTKESGLQFSYSRRITRPTFNDLAPFFTLLDPNLSLTGNIKLLPTFSNTFQSTYRFRKSYILTLGFTDTRNAISWNSKVLTDQNRQYITPDNIDHVRNYSLLFSFPYQVAPWWQSQLSMQAIRQEVSAFLNGTQYNRATQFGRFNASQTFRLPDQFTAELSGYYQTSSLLGINVIKGIGSVNIGLQKKLNHDKGTLRLSGEDIFWTQRLRTSLSNPDQGYDISFGISAYTRLVRLTYTRPFGSQTVKAANRRATGSDDERSRVSTN